MAGQGPKARALAKEITDGLISEVDKPKRPPSGADQSGLEPVDAVKCVEITFGGIRQVPN